jgi:hypothetical protein
MKGSGMPNMRGVMNGWTRRMTLIKRQQKVVDSLVQNIDTPFTFRGMIQPLNPKSIMLKPEGERAFEWIQIHCRANDASLLNVNDEIVYLGKSYKIMAQYDYSLNGFMEYHAIKDYQNGKP